MKLITKLAAVAAFAALTTTSAFAGPFYQLSVKNVKPRSLAAPVASMKCDSMTIQGDARHGSQVVSCERYAKLRPVDCRRACANK